MQFKEKLISLDEEEQILTITLELEPIKVGADKRKTLFTQDVVELLLEMGYDVQSVVQHSRISNFRSPARSTWKFALKKQLKKLKVKKPSLDVEENLLLDKKVEKTLEQPGQSVEPITKDT